MMTLRVGIDLGGTHYRVALINQEGEVLRQLNGETEAEKGPDYIIGRLIAGTEEVMAENSITGIGIGAPGPLDPVNGVILSPPNLPGWEEIQLKAIFQNHFQVPVSVNNDANAAAVAEALVGSGKGYASVFYITVSTGIGGGFVVDGKIHNGASGYAGEIGNMIVRPNGYKHASLNPGALEGYASGTAIGRIAKERLGITGGAGEVFKLAETGENLALTIIEEAVDYLAIGIANIVHTINPEIFVIGGGVMKSSELFFPILEKKVKGYLYSGLVQTLKIVPASLGGETGVIGAALLLEDYKE
jgi:glucokinase